MILNSNIKTKARVPPEARIIGANMRRIRESMRYSRAEIAEILGVSHQQVQKYESGQNRFPLEKLCRLRALYNIPYQVFFQGLQEETDGEPCKTMLKRLQAAPEPQIRAKILGIARVLAE